MSPSPSIRYRLEAPDDAPSIVSFSLTIGHDVTLDEDGTLRNQHGTALCRLVHLGRPIKRWAVQPLRELTADVPKEPPRCRLAYCPMEDACGAEGCQHPSEPR